MTEAEIQQPTLDERLEKLQDILHDDGDERYGQVKHRNTMVQRAFDEIRALILIEREKAKAEERETLNAMVDEAYKQGVRDGLALNASPKDM